MINRNYLSSLFPADGPRGTSTNPAVNHERCHGGDETVGPRDEPRAGRRAGRRGAGRHQLPTDSLLAAGTMVPFRPARPVVLAHQFQRPGNVAASVL